MTYSTHGGRPGNVKNRFEWWPRFFVHQFPKRTNCFSCTWLGQGVNDGDALHGVALEQKHYKLSP